jgi:hypothetical protein
VKKSMGKEKNSAYLSENYWAHIIVWDFFFLFTVVVWDIRKLKPFNYILYNWVNFILYSSIIKNLLDTPKFTTLANFEYQSHVLEPDDVFEWIFDKYEFKISI